MVAEFGYVTEVRILKTQLTLVLLHESVRLQTYQIAIGAGGFNDKELRGDMKTPEGEFYITEKMRLQDSYFLGSRWMQISYPNIEDAERGYRDGLIGRAQYDQIVEAIDHFETPPQDTALGGGIGIHGGSGNNPETRGDFWTQGCVGMHDADVNQVFECVFPQRTRVVIEH
jgi:murein L,D-transpeptidase YafK